MTYSVVIPAYNSERTITETLQSVLAQTCPPSDIVVVDDGSTDTTAQLVASFGPKVRLVSQTNMGCGGATTTGITATATSMIATLDADDLWVPHKMERQLAHFETLDERTISFTRSRQFRHGEPDNGTGFERDAVIRSTMVFRRTAFDEIGPVIDPAVGAGDMVDWLGRARAAGFNLDVLPEVLMLRRIIPGSMTYNAKDDSHRGYLSVARAAILRRRQADSK